MKENIWWTDRKRRKLEWYFSIKMWIKLCDSLMILKIKIEHWIVVSVCQCANTLQEQNEKENKKYVHSDVSCFHNKNKCNVSVQDHLNYNRHKKKIWASVPFFSITKMCSYGIGVNNRQYIKIIYCANMRKIIIFLNNISE